MMDVVEANLLGVTKHLMACSGCHEDFLVWTLGEPTKLPRWWWCISCSKTPTWSFV